jgi:hypothetical protein
MVANEPRKWDLGTIVYVESYVARPPDGSVQYFWFRRPVHMTKEKAFEIEEHHGPFTTEAAMFEDQKVTIFGE